MTREEKKLLLKDIAARLPYGVYLHNKNGMQYRMWGITDVLIFNENYQLDVYDVKPYLRPMSSMTEEELAEFVRFSDHIRESECKIHIANYNQLEWLNEHHFDYRGLINKGLALEAPIGMYKEE